MWLALLLSVVGLSVFVLTLNGRVQPKFWRLASAVIALAGLISAASYLPITVAFMVWLNLMLVAVAGLTWLDWLLGSKQEPSGQL